jgi:signal peptidase II
MAEVFRKKLLLFSALGGLLIIVDQLSKILIRLYGGFYICNPHIALGIAIPEILFWIFWTAIIILLFYLIYKESALPNALYLIIIFSGAFSNLFDRVQYGCIIDFINLGFGPIFNLADFFISLGAIMLIIVYLKIKH